MGTYMGIYKAYNMSMRLLTQSSLRKHVAAPCCCRSFASRSSPLYQQAQTSQGTSSSQASPPTTSQASKADPSKPAWFKITLMRSSIGLQPSVRATVTALGFKRRMQSVYSKIDQAAVGKILKVKELVKVETLTHQQKREETKPKIRSDNKGYTVLENVL